MSEEEAKENLEETPKRRIEGRKNSHASGNRTYIRASKSHFVCCIGGILCGVAWNATAEEEEAWRNDFGGKYFSVGRAVAATKEKAAFSP